MDKRISFAEMDEDKSHNLVLIENREDEASKPLGLCSETRPLFLLLEQLTSNVEKCNILVSSKHILTILEKEFNMNTSDLHELEINIYSNVIKKFLKEWPQWDSFGKDINRLGKKEVLPERKVIVEQNYGLLKEYLQSMIDIAIPLARSKCSKMLKEQAEKQSETSTEFVLEIHCTRKMFNNLIYEQPNVAQNNTIFNFTLPNSEPHQYKADIHFSMAAMLNWYNVCVSINLPYFKYSRATSHRLSHILVNEANGKRQPREPMDNNIYKNMKEPKTVQHDNASINSIKELFEKIQKHYSNKSEYNMVRDIFEVIKDDLLINSPTIGTPGKYKSHLSTYPYIRKLYTKVDGCQPSQMKLFIEETVIPNKDFCIEKFVNKLQPRIPSIQSWLKFECRDCTQTFKGAECLTLLPDHFKQHHIEEPDWSCSNCDKTFKMNELTHQGWRHGCTESNT